MIHPTRPALLAAAALLATTALLATAGCFSVKTESEIKPIHITMDINLKVDKELDRAFADENQATPKGPFKEVKAALDRQVAGLAANGLLVARRGATDDDKIVIAEANVRRQKRIEEIAKSSGLSLEAVQKRHARRMRERLAPGSGVWYQDDAGTWRQK